MKVQRKQEKTVAKEMKQAQSIEDLNNLNSSIKVLKQNEDTQHRIRFEWRKSIDKDLKNDMVVHRSI